MHTDILDRFREELAAGAVKLTEVAEESGIGLTTLSYMKNNDWAEGIFDKVDKLAAALDRLQAKRSEAASHGGASTAA